MIKTMSNILVALFKIMFHIIMAMMGFVVVIVGADIVLGGVRSVKSIFTSKKN